MTNTIPAPGEFYRHFKNKYYQVLAVATHSETKEKLVIYQALYDDFSVYARPLSMFISEVDHKKYPDVKQKFRFEKVDRASIKNGAKNPESQPEQSSEKKNPEKKDEEQETDEFVDRVFRRKKETKKEVYLEGPDQPSPILMEFLDLRTMDAKVRFLSDNKKKLTNEIINAMAASIDVTVPDGPLELRYSSLRSCLQTKAKYEITRLR